jgi:hypothetical protein
MAFNRSILHDRLLVLLRDFSREAIESRQIGRRLRDLLPQRLKRIHARHRALARTSGAAERLALIDSDYLEHLEEISLVTQSALEARIQYETHLMLFEARRTLRHFVK